MRCDGFLILTTLMALAIPPAPCAGATFGSVASIGGHASDMALDESRGLLYIANFTANCIDELKLADNSLQRCQFNVAPQPESLAISPDAQYLLIAHGPPGNLLSHSDNLLTIVHLPDRTQVRLSTGTDTPLAVAFFATVPNTGPANLSGPGKALVITTSAILTLEPATGVLTLVSTFASLVTTLPMPLPTFPGQILQTTVTTSADGLSVWGLADAGTQVDASAQPEIVYVFNTRTGGLSATAITAAPPLLPRVSVAADGSYAMVGYALFSAPAPLGPYPNLALLGRYPNRIASTNITGHAIDSKNNLIYAQIPDAVQPAGPPYTSANWPALFLMDADNLTVRDRLMMPESIVGRALLNSAATVLYAISDSGVMVLPVGQLNQYHRLATQEDLLIQSTFCNRSVAAQSLTITDPGGGHTDFSIAASAPGITVSPSFGTTPMTVQVMVDPAKFPALGTTAVTLTVSSATAINGVKTVRVLVNNPDVNQRGTIMNVPGVLTDILPDAARNRFYILRQDVNQVLVFDGTNNQQITAFRTATTPMKMSFTIDRKYLLVAHNDSQLVTRYDLDQMQRVKPVLMPGGHFAISIAESNALLAVLARDEGASPMAGVIESINLASGTATPLATLGIWQNSVATYLPGMLAPSGNGRSILMATGGGQVALYSADANTFVAGRKDFTSLSGAVAASSMDTYVIGNNIFNSSLVPQATMDAAYGTTSGFSFFDGTSGGYRATASSASDRGVMQNLPSLITAAVQPVSMTEAPLLPTPSNTFTRTVAPLPASGTVIALTTSGFTVLSANYAASTAPPVITSVVNAANGNSSVAPGGLISVYGSQLSPSSIATSQIPLPRALGESCLIVNGASIPLLFVSAQQINAQLPFNVNGMASMQIHTPAGVSNNFNFTMQSAAPAVFQSGTAGPETGLATIVRADNGELVTPTNPIHYNDTVVIYLTGMGTTSPSVDAGLATPVGLLSSVTQWPQLTLGGSPLNVLYAGLAPGFLSGLYQINATVPGGVTQGMDIPLVISQGGASTTLNVRVVK